MQLRVELDKYPVIECLGNQQKILLKINSPIQADFIC